MKSEEKRARALRAFTLQDYETADKLSRELVEEYPHSWHAHMLLGTIATQQQNYPAAEQSFTTAIKLQPENAEAYNNMAVVYRHQNKLNDALELAKTALTFAPERADILYNLGNILKRLGEKEKAKQVYREAIRRDPDFVMAYNNLGTLYEQEGDHAMAVKVLQSGLEHDENHPTLQYNLGISLLELHRLSEAKQAFGRALRSKPGWVDALNNLGIVHQRLEEYEEAQTVFEEILSISPENPRALNNIASLLSHAGKYEEAGEYLRRSLRRDPSYRKAAANLGQVLARTDGSSYLDELRELVAKSPQNIDLRYQLADLLAKHEKYEDARRQLLELLEMEADHVEALQLLAKVAFRLGLHDESREYIQRLQQMDAPMGTFQLDLARIELEMELYVQARSRIEEYLTDHEDDIAAYGLLAEILAAQNKLETAIEMIEQKLESFPGNAYLLSLLARFQSRLGNKEQAMAATEELISLQGSRANSEDISALNESLDLYEEIVSSFQEELAESWQRNIEKLGRLVTLSGERLSVPQELESESGANLETDDSVPILDFEKNFFQDIEEDYEQDEDEEPFDTFKADRNADLKAKSDTGPETSDASSGGSGGGSGRSGQAENPRYQPGQGSVPGAGGETNDGEAVARDERPGSLMELLEDAAAADAGIEPSWQDNAGQSRGAEDGSAQQLQAGPQHPSMEQPALQAQQYPPQPQPQLFQPQSPQAPQAPGPQPLSPPQAPQPQPQPPVQQPQASQPQPPTPQVPHPQPPVQQPPAQQPQASQPQPPTPPQPQPQPHLQTEQPQAPQAASLNADPDSSPAQGQSDASSQSGTASLSDIADFFSSPEAEMAHDQSLDSGYPDFSDDFEIESPDPAKLPPEMQSILAQDDLEEYEPDEAQTDIDEELPEPAGVVADTWADTDTDIGADTWADSRSETDETNETDEPSGEDNPDEAADIRDEPADGREIGAKNALEQSESSDHFPAPSPGGPSVRVPSSFTESKYPEDETRVHAPLPAAAANPKLSQANMLEYLMKLTNDLPQDKHRAFLDSDIPLKIESVRSRLLGKEGLRNSMQKANLLQPPAVGNGDGKKGAVTPKSLAETFKFIQDMSVSYPDHRIGEALGARVRRILQRIESAGQDKQAL
ncbi:MAG: tetratricopeptide repeat protein [Spirochaeta sp.]